MRRLGEFREFWPEQISAPTLLDALDAEMPASLRRLVAFYLTQGGVLLYTMERLPDVIDGEEVFLTGGLRTDGEWYWRADLAHYVLKHGLVVPREFIESASGNDWSPPDLPEAERGALAARLRRDTD